MHEFESSRPRVHVTLRVRGEALGDLRARVEPSAREHVPREGEGWVELTLPFERVEYAHTELVPLGAAVEVLEPAELRERIAATGRALAAVYGAG